MNNNSMLLIFKLFNSIKSPHEADYFARLEIEGLTGVKPTKIQNFTDVLDKKQIKIFKNEKCRIQDMLMHEIPYGKTHGYLIKTKEIIDITSLLKRLGYTREIFAILKGENPLEILEEIFPSGIVGKNVEYFQNNCYILFHFITHQYYWENSEYISKLSRNETEIENNVQILLKYLIKNRYRVPASATLRIGRRLEDYFAIREELSLYLTHYMHPYKGKFHPKMVRALLNYILPENADVTVLDNFAGSGTLLLEATLMEINSIGVEINPLSILMTNVKCHSLSIDIKLLKQQIDEFLSVLTKKIRQLTNILNGQSVLGNRNSLNIDKIKKEKNQIPSTIMNGLGNRNSNFLIEEILMTKHLIEKLHNNEIKDFMFLTLSGSISDAYRRKKIEFVEIFKERIYDLYLDLYIYHTLNSFLKITPGKALGYVGDTRDMKKLENGNSIPDKSIDGIVNSPPYSTALDYIKNDEPQLEILDLVNSMEHLKENMVGNPRKNYNSRELVSEINKNHKDYLNLPDNGKEIINILKNGNRIDAVLRCYKFFKDMDLTAKEMYRVLKPGAKCVIIIGNNHFMIHNKYFEVKNANVVLEICKKAGLKVDITIERELQKSSVGNIRRESVLILYK